MKNIKLIYEFRKNPVTAGHRLSIDRFVDMRKNP